MITLEIIFFIYLIIGYIYITFDWIYNHKESYENACISNDTDIDESGIIAYILCGMAFWPIIMILKYVLNKKNKRIIQ